MRKILVVCAHPDDEVYGMGGTIRKLADKGDQIVVLALTDGSGSRGKVDPERQSAFLRAARVLGVHKIVPLDFEDQKLDSYPMLEIIQQIESIVKKFSPDVVFTHNLGDLNLDHRIVGEATMVACRPKPGSCIKKLYTFETTGGGEWAFGKVGTKFEPNVFIDVSEYDVWRAKEMAMEIYGMELEEYPHPRSFKGERIRDKYRGLTIGKGYTEAFELVFSIEEEV